MKTMIKSFTDLDAWKVGHQLVLTIYDKTRLFPKDELYGLVSQMRRAALSITSNIAEGFARNTKRDKFQFYTIALASLRELQNQLLAARDISYLAKQDFNEISEATVRVSKLVSGLLKSAQDRYEK